MSCKLVWITPNAEKVIAYCARVSNPANQDSGNIEGLLRYCAKHGHWSVFEMANACIEIKTSRAISAQIIRHRSFSFQEFSQRYAENTSIEIYKARNQDIKNRQNSIDDVDEDTQEWFLDIQDIIAMHSMGYYLEALNKGIAKECARMLLPMATTTSIYMNGNIRSWIHYLQLRCDAATQLEHRLIAQEIRTLLIKELPILQEILGD